MIEAVLFLTFFVCALAATWLWANRPGNYTRWFYLAQALGFTCLAVGTLPDMRGLTMLGAIIVIIASGLTLIIKVIVEYHAQHGMDIRAGKLMISHPK